MSCPMQVALFISWGVMCVRADPQASEDVLARAFIGKHATREIPLDAALRNTAELHRMFGATKETTQSLRAFMIQLNASIDRPNWLGQEQVLSLNNAPLIAVSAYIESAREVCASRKDLDCEAAEAFQHFFKHSSGGLTLELGGLDGVKLSESLPFEKHANFRRIVIDANPNYRAFRRQHAPESVGILAAVCSDRRELHYLTDQRRPIGQGNGIAEFMGQRALKKYHPDAYQALRRAHDDMTKVDWAHVTGSAAVTCVPLQLILDVLGVKRINFAIIDVEGAEPSILKTLNLRRTRIDVLVVECRGAAGDRTKAVIDAVLGPENVHPYRLWKVKGRNIWFTHTQFRRDRAASH